MPRRITLALLAGIACAVHVGCARTYFNEPLTRQDQLSEKSEDVRQVGDMHWGRDEQGKTEHLTPVRIHGSIE